MEDGERDPRTRVQYKGEREVMVTLLTPGLKPGKIKAAKKDKNNNRKKGNDNNDQHDAANGEADVTFTAGGCGMDARISVDGTSKGEATVWRSIIRRFPSRIDTKESSWTVEENKVVIILVKAKEPGKKEFVDWEPLVRKNTLDQYRENEDPTKEMNVFDPSRDAFPTTIVNIVAVHSDRGGVLVEREPP